MSHSSSLGPINFTVIINFSRNIRTYLVLSVLLRKQLNCIFFIFPGNALNLE